MKVGMPSPKYIRGISFNNQSGTNAVVTCQFRSGEVQVYTIPAGGGMIEKAINQGSFSTTDPIVSWSVNVGGVTTNFGDDSKQIEVRSYTIYPSGQLQRMQ